MARPESAPKTPLAARFREVRKVYGDPERGEFAKRLGLSLNSISRYERGEQEPSHSAFAAYSSKLGVNAHWLVTGHGEMMIGAATQVENASLADVRKYVWNIANTFWKKLPRNTSSEQAADQFLEMFDYLINRPAVSEEAASEVIEFSVERKRRASDPGEP